MTQKKVPYMLKLFINWALNHLCVKYQIDPVCQRLPPLVPYAIQTKGTKVGGYRQVILVLYAKVDSGHKQINLYRNKSGRQVETRPG